MLLVQRQWPMYKLSLRSIKEPLRRLPPNQKRTVRNIDHQRGKNRDGSDNTAVRGEHEPMDPVPVDPGTIPEHEPMDPVPVHPVTAQDPQDTPWEKL